MTCGGGGFFAGDLAEVGADAGEEFGHGEGLGDVVVGAFVECGDLHGFLLADGEDDDGGFGGAADGAGEFDAGHLGHGEVGDDEVGLGGGEEVEGFEAVVGDGDFVAGGLEGGAEDAGDLALVVDDEDTHANDSCGADEASAIFLGDDVEVDVGGFGHEALDGEEVEVFAEAVEGGAAEEGLRDALLGDVGGGGGGDAFAGEVDDVGAEVFGELEGGFEGALAVGGFVFVGLDVEDVELAAEAFGEAGAAGDEVAGLGAVADADGYFFGDGPVRAELLALDVVVEGAVDGAGDAVEGHFAEGDEVAAAEEVGEGALGAVDGVDVAAAHAGDEGFGGEVGDDDFVGAIEDPVGHGLADGDAGEALDARREAFDVLDVDGGEDVDVGVEEEEDVFVALGVARADDVGVGEFVDEDDLGFALEDGVDVHLVEEGAFVIDLAGGDVFELGGEFGGAFAAVGFDYADDDVFSALAAANAFREHAEGFADTGSVADEDLEAAAGFLGLGGDQPVFGRLPRCGIGRQVVVSPCELAAGSGRISMDGGSGSAGGNCSRISPMAAC